MAAIRGNRVTAEARESMAAQLKTAYHDGASIRALSEQSGRSYGFVHRLLVESGAEMRGRGGNTRGK